MAASEDKSEKGHKRRRSLFTRRRKRRGSELRNESADPLGLAQPQNTRHSDPDGGSDNDNDDDDDDDDEKGSELSIQIGRSVGSSNVTEDEADEDPSGATKRPQLVSRDSHRGFLTLTSPLITSPHANASTSSLSQNEPQPPSDSVAPRRAKTTLDVPPPASRSPSPGKKLKDAFTPKKSPTFKKTDSESSISGASTSGRGFGLRKKKSKSSVADESAADSSTVDEARPPTAKTTASAKASLAHIDIDAARPVTPGNLERAPTTLVTPPTPTELRRSTFGISRSFKSDSDPDLSTLDNSAPPIPPLPNPSNPDVVVSPSGNMISHRRAKSASNPPSKLSHSVTAPLTPTLEEIKTPGGTVSLPNSNSFFSSVFSAAQNATSSLSNSIANPTFFGGKSKAAISVSDSPEKGSSTQGETASKPESEKSVEDDKAEKRHSALDTLGSGNLSLSHLGITESPQGSPMSSKTENTDPPSAPLNGPQDAVVAQADDQQAARAVSAAYLDRPNGERISPGSPPRVDSGRPMVLPGSETPPKLPAPDVESLSGVRRTGSVRSKLSGGARRRRHRDSTGTSTGSAIAAAIGASTAALANPATGQRMTGFAVASSKRNREFHAAFRSVPEDDYLIEDYSAALQRDILLHGRFYVSEGHICFSSNILGWVTNLVISFDEVVSIEKKSTAVIFPNAIVIQTLHARNVFASFVSRDSTYDLLIGIWKISHPNLKSSVNGVTLADSGTGDKTEKAESVGSDEGSSSGSDDDVYDEDAEEEERLTTGEGDASIAGSDVGDTGTTVTHKASKPTLENPSGVSAVTKAIESPEAVAVGASAVADFPGPPAHPPTDCGDADTHYEKLLTDTTIPSPLGKIYSLMFGPASGAFMRKWLIEDQKSMDLQMEDDGKGLGESKKTFSYSFIKPLSAPIGPKQTKCIINMTLQHFDLEKSVTVDCSTQNPDVPSGNIFLVKTKYCLMWAPGNSTRLIMTCTIEWSGRSFLKGAIEKGTNDGQAAYAKDLVAALRAAVTKPTAAVAKGRATGKAGKKGRKARDLEEEERLAKAAEDAKAANNKTGAAVASSNWGLLEPIHALVGPIIDPIISLVGMPVLLGILFASFLLMWWSRRGSSTPSGLGHGVMPGFGPPGWIPPAERVAAYEEIWRSEEAALWDWLEERVGAQRATGGFAKSSGSRPAEASAAKGKRGSQAEVQEAIRITEEKLARLKESYAHKSDGKEAHHGAESQS